ncbi:MAG: MYXO-CTERM sorting domain-containing protein [Myxococcaceae bacterium]
MASLSSRSQLLAVVLATSALVARADYMDHFVVREDIGTHKAPYLGDAKVVLIPIEVAGFPPLDVAKLESFFSPDDSVGFVKFYETASLGRYRPRVTVAPKVTYASCPLPADKFPGCKVARGDINAFQAGMDMMRDVLKKTDEAGFDFTPYDVNGRRGTPDGYLDGVMMLTNVPFGGIAFPIGYFNRGDNLAGGTGGALIVDGLKVNHIAIAGDGDHLVMVHEFGHLLGLTDLYDESQKYDGLYLSWMGAWLYGPAIPLPDAETRFRLRWANWHQVQGRQRVSIKPAETSGDVYRLGTGDEYFLIENRGPGQHFDLSLSERGLAIFHVDRTVKLGGVEGNFVDRILDCVNCDPWHPYIRLLQADNLFDIEHNKKFGPGDLFVPGTFLRPDERGIPVSEANPVNSSNYYSGKTSGIRLEDVKLLDDGTIEATLDAPTEGQCGETLCSEGEGCAPVACGEPAPKGCTSVPAGPLLALGLLLLEQRFRRRDQRFLRRA